MNRGQCHTQIGSNLFQRDMRLQTPVVECSGKAGPDIAAEFDRGGQRDEHRHVPAALARLTIPSASLDPHGRNDRLNFRSNHVPSL